jgi:hypothetical protein
MIDVAVEPAGTRKLDTETRLDLRAEKQFRTPRGTFALTIDVFNVMNQGTVNAVQTLQYEAANFGLPAGVQAPRQARVSAKWSF